MPKPRVFVTRPIFKEALDRVSQVADMEVWPQELPPQYETLVDKARDADGLLTLLTDRMDAALMDAGPRLKVISNMAVGYDNISIPDATKRHILVGYTPGVLTETTADLAFALIMAAARRVVEADRFTREGRWKTWGPMTLLGQDIHDATLGIVGLGRIGSEVARRATGFRMKVIYSAARRHSEEEERALGVEYAGSLADLLSRSDFVSVHVPLTTQTNHMIGPAQLALMKPNAVLVNTSRGPVVDQKALYEALKAGRIFAAGLDVTEIEPIPPDDSLLGLHNVIVLPHIGSASVATRTKMAVMAADNLIAGLRGDLPPNCVNPEALAT